MTYPPMLCRDVSGVDDEVFRESIAAGRAGWPEEMRERGKLVAAGGRRPVWTRPATSPQPNWRNPCGP